MPHYKLVYFASRGGAESIRLAFAYAGVPFEDVRMPGPQLFAARAEGKIAPPYNQFPILYVDDKVLAQSYSILRYVASQTGLTPKDAFDAAVADSQLEQFKDIMRGMWDALGKPEAEKAAAVQTFTTEKFPAMVKGLANYIGDNHFFGGAEPNHVDLAWYALVESGRRYGFDAYAASPAALQRVFDGVAKHPKLAAYFKHREEVEAAEAAAAAAAKAQ